MEPSRSTASRTGLELNEGDVIRIHTGSGGGYGDPRRRRPTRMVDDLRQGYVTAERARCVYGTAPTS